MQKKKICFVVSSPLTVKALLFENIKTLSTVFDVYVVANFENEEQKKASPYIKGVHHVQLERKINLIKDIRAVFSLVNYFNRNRFDAIHTVTPKAALLGMMAGKIAQIPVRTHIFTGQVWYTRTGLMKWMLKKFDRLVVFFSTNVLVDGISQRNFLISQKIISKKHSTVLGRGSICGVNVERFSPDPAVRERLRKDLGYLDEEVVFLFMGRINRDKGVVELVQAFSKLQQEINNVKLILVGFDEENLVPDLMKSVGGENCIFYGSTPDPELVMQIGDVLCLPSHREGFGTTVIEGAALGLPVLCSNTYGLQGTIIENQTGLRHKVGDAEEIYRLMRVFAQNSELRSTMGAAGRQYVLKNFTSAQISNYWLEFYRTLLV